MMPPERVFQKLLEMDEVDDVLPLIVEAPKAMKLSDGRWLMPVNIYLRDEPDESALGVQVQDGVGVGDHFGGL